MYTKCIYTYTHSRNRLEGLFTWLWDGSKFLQHLRQMWMWRTWTGMLQHWRDYYWNFKQQQCKLFWLCSAWKMSVLYSIFIAIPLFWSINGHEALLSVYFPELNLLIVLKQYLKSSLSSFLLSFIFLYFSCISSKK